MTTLESIGFTIVTSSSIGAVSLLAFACAVVNQSVFVAPRATARPREVIYNPDAQPPNDDEDGERSIHIDDIDDNNNKQKKRGFHEQYRGNPLWGWICWTLSLDYNTLIEGVPGTGTRDRGMSGSLLRVNLDGILLLRFHAMGLRITAFISALCLGVLLPIFLSAQCYKLDSDEERAFCSSQVYNLTNYEKTTIANIPSEADEKESKNSGATSNQDLLPDDGDFFGFLPSSGIYLRLYAVVVAYWIIVLYTCYQLRLEWIEMLAMRRVYYLEKDVWRDRQKELVHNILKKQHSQSQSGSKGKAANAATSKPEEENRHLYHRDPWIPHPEQRDTVPNIGLYSILVGGLPSLPEQASDTVDRNTTIKFSQRESTDWQLTLTSAFFDHCVPNQPGFSSSVVAVTIIPSARDLTLAWRKWYAAAAKLRRLQFIREQIAKKRHYLIDDVNDSVEIEFKTEDKNDMDIEDDAETLEKNIDMNDDAETFRPVYTDPKAKEYVRELVGSAVNGQNVPAQTPVVTTRFNHDNDGYNMLEETVPFGPEQSAVYSREFAQAAAPCCPRGCMEGRVRRASIDELVEMERIAVEELHEANLELKEARRVATRADQQETNDAPDEVVTASETKSDGRKFAHARIKSLDSAQMPGDLDLEASLYNKTVGGSKQLTAVADADESEELAGRLNKEKGMNSNKEGGLNTMEQGERLADTWETSRNDFDESEKLETGSRAKRIRKQSNASTLNPWEQVQRIVARSHVFDSQRRPRIIKHVRTGLWKAPNLFRSAIDQTIDKATNVKDWAQKETTAVVDDILLRETAYAVVTFSSRQAAVAARNCLADGRGAGRWQTFREIPIPPLADAAPWDIMAFRNCCRPLAMSVNDRQKQMRSYISFGILVFLYFGYTIPLTAASSLMDPTTVSEIFPKFSEWSEKSGFALADIISGFLQAMIWSCFFALSPVLFKAIANFGSGATSVASAEYRALQYYWYFMVATAFSGQLLAQTMINALNDKLSLGSDLRSILREIALTIPSTISVSWLNWIIYRLFITLPLNYLLQFNTFLFSALGMKCCSRVVRGGGPGGVVPYRIFVDSGVVLMCALALAPASPLVAPAAAIYFLICQPILRRNLIFVYRPKFDGGALRWPFVFMMCISAMMVGSILLTVQMGLKQAIGPAALASTSIIPIYLSLHSAKKKYLRAYEDAALLQTSLLDGWDTTKPSSVERREEFRRFLVDAHKAAYVPVCLATTDTEELLTAEPAVVVPLESDLKRRVLKYTDGKTNETSNDLLDFRPIPKQKQSQRCAMLRRSVQSFRNIQAPNLREEISIFDKESSRKLI